jgi:hypothetical protein
MHTACPLPCFGGHGLSGRATERSHGRLFLQGTPVFNAPTLAAKNLLHFAQGVLVLRKQYRNMLSPPMFDSPRAIR